MNVRPPIEPPMARDRRDDLAELRLVVDGEFGRAKRGGLQLDAAFPGLAQLGEHRPGNRGLLAERSRCGCGSRRCRGRRRSAARNPCARARRRPSSSPRGRRRRSCERQGKCRPGSVRAMPDVALVEVRVAIDEARQGEAAAQVDAGRPSASVLPARPMPGDAAVADDDIAGEPARRRPAAQVQRRRRVPRRHGRWQARRCLRAGCLKVMMASVKCLGTMHGSVLLQVCYQVLLPSLLQACCQVRQPRWHQVRRGNRQ